MIVCHCHAVSDREIHKIARDAAPCPMEVQRLCGAGGECGGCKPHVEQIVARAAMQHRGSAARARLSN